MIPIRTLDKGYGKLDYTFNEQGITFYLVLERISKYGVMKATIRYKFITLAKIVGPHNCVFKFRDFSILSGNIVEGVPELRVEMTEPFKTYLSKVF